MSCEKWKSRPLSNHWKNNQGFTLLEVIIALGIVAVGILAVSRAITGFADTTITLEQRMLASWVASNRLETLKISKTSPVPGTTHGSEEMADRVWYFREATIATADPNLFRIDITVFADKEETEEVGQLYGYLLNEAGINLPIITSEWVGANTFSAHQRANKFAPTEGHRDSNVVGSNLFEQGTMGFGHET